MTRVRVALACGRVRRVSPGTCVIEPFAGSSADEVEQLRWLAKTHAAKVPFGCGWPLESWARNIGFEAGDVAAMVWLLAYVRRRNRLG